MLNTFIYEKIKVLSVKVAVTLEKNSRHKYYAPLKSP